LRIRPTAATGTEVPVSHRTGQGGHRPKNAVTIDLAHSRSRARPEPCSSSRGSARPGKGWRSPLRASVRSMTTSSSPCSELTAPYVAEGRAVTAQLTSSAFATGWSRAFVNSPISADLLLDVGVCGGRPRSQLHSSGSGILPVVSGGVAANLVDRPRPSPVAGAAARCSTDQQDLTAQRDGLAALGVAANRVLRRPRADRHQPGAARSA
jgi:hypothetical protein